MTDLDSQIARCEAEIAEAVAVQRPGDLSAVVWELDWVTELARLRQEESPE